MTIRYRYDLIAANDRAVELLHRAAYSRAIQTLESAMRFLRTVAAADAEPSQSQPQPQPQAAETAIVMASGGAGAASGEAGTIERGSHQAVQQQQQWHEDRHGNVGDLRIQASGRRLELWSARCPEGAFSFCSRPMILVGTQEQVIRSPHNQYRAAAALMYNLSLAYQGAFGTPAPPALPPRSGPFPGATPASSPESLLAALGDRILEGSLKLCTMAAGLMARIPAPAATMGDSVMYASSLNNQGFLHMYFSNRAEANRSMSVLEGFFASFAQEDEHEYEYGYQPRYGPPPSPGRDANKRALDDVLRSVLLCQGRAVLDAAPAA